MKPLAFDLFCGLGGWTEGLLMEGFDVIGFDIERHVYGNLRYPSHLIIQDVTSLHGSQLRDARLIVASPPCQTFSYMAMPWSKGKLLAADIRADQTGEKLENLTRLFKTCFRLQGEASEASGRHIPIVVENVRGAQDWVGRARWNYGSFYLWGDVPALMPTTRSYKSSGMNWCDRTRHGQCFTKVAGMQAMEGIKQGGNWWHNEGSISRLTSSKSEARRQASAMIAKIPLPLSRHIARSFF